ncbi:hypothetical protein [Peribacillus sp. NPDC096540]|uniref:hypothetical protein n=1 Tax=Peribacillus sp. NPDC096540 TaxID=3390612 RepID=UPI003D011F5E
MFQEESNTECPLDIQVDDDTVRVKNVYETKSVPWIVLTGELAKFIKGYYDLRMKHATQSEATSYLFFLKYWNGRELEIEPDIAGVKSNGFVDEITAENILLFSPNSLFNRYIASVLPDLGKDSMQQLTFQDNKHTARNNDKLQ